MLKISLSLPLDGRPVPSRLSIHLDNVETMGPTEIGRIAGWLDAIKTHLKNDRDEHDNYSLR